jgi:hypothetical protein
VGQVTKAEAKACLASADNESSKATTNRVIDMTLIVLGSVFAGGGAATTTASSFISDTHNGGQPSDTKQWAAGTGAVATGIGAGFLALRTALDLGVVSSAETSASATQAGLAMQILDSDDAGTTRDGLYGQCTHQTAAIVGAYPASTAVPSSSATPAPAASTSGH